MQRLKSSHLRPDFTGIWRANLEKSILRGPAPREILHRIEHRDPHLDQEILLAQASGNEQRLIFSYNTTGDETTNSIGARTARTRAWWDGAELVIESWLETPDRQLHFKDHWSLSDDGETLTMAHRDDDLAGQIVLHNKTPLFLLDRSGAVT
jgi:RimJ/RimL family protein N-acetyltransferase